jgi:hypothetical protein
LRCHHLFSSSTAAGFQEEFHPRSFWPQAKSLEILRKGAISPAAIMEALRNLDVVAGCWDE